MNEFEVRDKLAEERKKIKSVTGLSKYIKDIKDNYNYDYGVAPRAIAQATLATAWFLASKMGITGFQAGFVMWDFIREWNYSHNKCGLKIVDYDNMLYPQYEYYFQKTISSDTWVALQKQAKKNLEERDSYSAPQVVQHWQSIVDGVVPFGYVVKERE